MGDAKLYYHLENFYGSHKNYVESRNFIQLRGESKSTSNCSPITKNKDIPTNLRDFSNSTDLIGDNGAIPCGLPAKYFFQDSFTLADSSGSQITIDSKDIALGVDKDSRF